ncbi:hypothetical protein JCM6882_004250 [Rhodosporidiobolus microsporus]
MLSSALLRSTRPAVLARPQPARFVAPTFARSITASAPRLADNSLSDGEKALKDKIEGALEGAKVEVQDVSGGCGSFYAISIAHGSFKGLSMIKQHRIVNELLKDEIKDMHGLQLKTKAA